MGGFHVHGRERDFLLTTDLTEFYRNENDTSHSVASATEYYNRPEPHRGNRRERRAKAAQERRNKA